MTEKMDEQISALVDDEVHGSELEKVISRLTDDPAAAERWQRYNLISDALHNNLPERVETELSRRVQEALKDEPTVLAPRRMRIPPRLRPAIKQIGGMAVAASVAVVMVTALQEQPGSGGGVPLAKEGQDGSLSAPVMTRVADVAPSGAGAMRVASQPVAPPATVMPQPHPVQVAETHSPQPVVVSPHAFDPRFESYLINHSEYAVTTGMLPYSRVMAGNAGGISPQYVSGE